MIKHIVISGGATSGVSMLSMLKTLNDNKFYNYNNIETLWGTSAGSIIIVLLALNLEWNSIYTYITERPWDKILTIHPTNLLESYTKKGLLCSYDLVKKFFIPLFKTKDINIDITMRQFYEVTKIKIFIFSTSVNQLESVNFSYLSHPDMEVMRAVSLSSAIPFVFKPIMYENNYYCDGGLVNNFPLLNCVNYIKEKEKEKDIKTFEKEILGITGIIDGDVDPENLKESDNIFQYFMHIIYKFIDKSKLQYTSELEKLITSLPYVITFHDEKCNFNKLKKAVYKKERIILFEKGEKIAKKFLKEKT